MSEMNRWKRQTPPTRRVVLLVLDGLRADLVGDSRFPHLATLREQSAYTLDATTVLPSVTAAAMTSLLAGVSPCDHGITNDRFAVPPYLHRLRPLPREVARAGLRTTGIVREVPWPLRPLARRIVRELGLAQTHFAPPQARELLRRALPALREQREGLIVMHWPDCDAVGHRDGWMSRSYFEAVSGMDDALGAMRHALHESEQDTLLVTLADHGGGGRVATHHDSAHPLDCTIPILLSGAGVVPQLLSGTYTLLDAPPTVLWALGLAVPGQWTGEPIVEAFRTPDANSVRSLQENGDAVVRVSDFPRWSVA